MKKKVFSLIDKIKIPPCLNCNHPDNTYFALDYKTLSCCSCGTKFMYRFEQRWNETTGKADPTDVFIEIGYV